MPSLATSMCRLKASKKYRPAGTKADDLLCVFCVCVLFFLLPSVLCDARWVPSLKTSVEFQGQDRGQLNSSFRLPWRMSPPEIPGDALRRGRMGDGPVIFSRLSSPYSTLSWILPSRRAPAGTNLSPISPLFQPCRTRTPPTPPCPSPAPTAG